jgi:multiple sugar transport system substrate-binding protein
MIRRIFSTIAATAIALTLTSAVVHAQSPEKITLLVGSWAVDPLTPWVEQFTEETGIEVDIQSFPFRDLLQTIEVRGTAKADDVDVIFVDAPLVPSYAERGLIAPMEKYFTAEEPSTLWADATIAAASWKDELWAPPLNNSSQVLYYNRDLLSAAGVSEPSADPQNRTTWEDIVTGSQKIANPDNGKWGLMFDQVSRYYQLQALPESLGGGSGVDESGLSVEGTLTNDGWLKAATFYFDTFNTWKISPKGITPAQTADLFAAGDVAFFAGGPWNIKKFEETGVNYGMALYPYFEEGVPVTATNSWHIGLWNYSTHADSAARLARFLTASPEIAIDYVEAHGQLPAHTAALRNIEESPKYDNFPNSGIKLATYEAANTAVTRARTPAFLEFEEIVNNSFEDIRNGADPATVLAEAELRIQSAMRRYK